MKINGNEIKPGNLIEHNGGLYRATKVQHVKPGKGGAFAQVELKEIRNGEETIGVTIPEKLVCVIAEADAVVKGQTASSSYKPAKLENGLAILVPPHIEAGTRVVVNTTTGEYLERAKD